MQVVPADVSLGEESGEDSESSSSDESDDDDDDDLSSYEKAQRRIEVHCVCAYVWNWGKASS